MNSTKLSTNFTVQEFVPPETFNRFGHKSCWFIRPELIKLVEYFRSEFGVPVIINDWSWGGAYKYSGFRPITTAVGGSYSQHRLGCAADLKFKGLSVQEVYSHIMENKARQARFFAAGLRVLEDIAATTTGNAYGGWLHTDIRNTGLNHEILIVQP